MENNNLHPLKRLSKKHYFGLGMLALAVLVLPLAVIAAQLATNLSSKAYLPTPKPTGISAKPICTGSVENISYGSSCGLSQVTPTPDPTCTSWFDGCNTCAVVNGELTRCTKIACKDNAGVPRCLQTITNTTPTPVCITTPGSITYATPCTGRGPSYMGINFVCPDGSAQKYTPSTCTVVDDLHAAANKICSEHSICKTRTDTTQNIQRGLDEATSNAKGLTAESIPALTTGFLGASVTCAGGYSENISASICRSLSDIKAFAAKICSQHPVCPTPTPTAVVQTCKSSVIKYTLQSPCKGTAIGSPTPTSTALIAEPRKGYTLDTQSEVGAQSTTGSVKYVQYYSGVNFTCADGTTQTYTTKSCAAEKDLFKQAENVCQNHLITNQSFGKKCVSEPRDTIQTTDSLSIPRDSTVGSDSIKFTCPDNFTSEYKANFCTSQAELVASANKICATHLTCPESAKPTVLKLSERSGVVTAIYQNTSAGAGDWIGIYKPNVDNTKPLDWKWLNNAQGNKPVKVSSAGTVNFKALPSGDYEVRYLKSGTAVPGSFTPGVSIEILELTAPTPSPISVSTTPTKPAPKNSMPQITSSSLVSGVSGNTYNTTISAKDADVTNDLTMTISGLPFGLYQGPCNEQVTTSAALITCTISGTPTRSGAYTVTAKVRDNYGLTSSKSLTLTVRQVQAR